MGIKVHTRDELIDYLNKHGFTSVQEAIRRRKLYNSDLSSEEITKIQKFIESLSPKTDTSHGLYLLDRENKTIYKFNTSLRQYDENRQDGHDGFEVIDKVNISTLTVEQLNKLEHEYKERRLIDTIISRIRHEKGSSDYSILNVEDRQAGRNDVLLDRQSSQGEPIGGRNNTSSRANQGESEIATFATPQGEVYGFVDEKGDIYLDETVITAEHPIHEFTHLWDRMV